MTRVYLEIGLESREYRLVTAARAGRGHLRIVLDGVTGRESAEALSSAVLSVATSDLPALKPGEFYHFQIIGIEVRLTDGRPLGRIEDIISTGANDVWVVRGERGEVMVPVIEDVVKAIDLAARVATIEAIPGLLE